MNQIAFCLEQVHCTRYLFQMRRDLMLSVLVAFGLQACQDEPRRPGASVAIPAPQPGSEATRAPGSRPTPTAERSSPGTPQLVGELFHETASPAGRGRSALAIGGGWVYWVAHEGEPGMGTLRRKPAGGGAVEDVATARFGGWAAIAADDQAVYFVAGKALASRPHAGGQPRRIVEVADAGHARQLVIGAEDIAMAGDERLVVVRKDGTEPLTFAGRSRVATDGRRFFALEAKFDRTGRIARLVRYARGEAPVVLAKDFEEPGELTGLGFSGGHVYFTSRRDVGDGKAALFRVSADRGGAPELAADASWGLSPFVIADGVLYGAISTERVPHVQKLRLGAGAKPTMLGEIRGPTLIPDTFAVDGQHLYFLTYGDRRIERLPR